MAKMSRSASRDSLSARMRSGLKLVIALLNRGIGAGELPTSGSYECYGARLVWKSTRAGRLKSVDVINLKHKHYSN